MANDRKNIVVYIYKEDSGLDLIITGLGEKIISSRDK